MRKKTLLLINILLILSMLLTACGGGGDDKKQDPTEPPPTQASVDTPTSAPTTAPPTKAPLPTDVPATLAPTDTPKPTTHETTINALFYFTGPDGTPGGLTKPVRIQVRPSEAEELRVGFYEEEVGGSGPMWNSAGWMAVTLGSMLLGAKPADYEFSFSVGGQVDGPSAGGLMTIGVLAALRGDTVREDAAMTGTINPDGTIGPVGGIPQKIQGAAAEGKTFILVPAGQRHSIDMVTGEYVDVVEVGQANGAEVREVSNVYEAYELLTGNPLPRPDVSSSQPQLPSKAFDRLEAKAQEWYSRYLDERNQFNTKDPDIQEAFAYDIAEVDALAAKADSALTQGMPGVAYNRAFEAAAQMQLYNLAADIVLRYRDTGLDDAIDYLNASSVAESELDAVISLLKTEEPATVSDYLALFEAYSYTSAAEGLILIAQGTVQGLLNNAANMTDEEILSTLAEATGYYTVARLAIQLSRDTTGLYMGYGSTPAPPQEDVFALAEALRRASEANLGYFDSVIVDEYAKAFGIHPDIMHNRFLNLESDYLMATASNQGIGILQSKVGSGPESGSLVMGHSLMSYVSSSKLVAKWYSLDAQMDADGNVYQIGRERALADMLNFAEQRAVELINLCGDDVPVPAIVYYDIARISRQGTVDDQIDALGSYWRAASLAQVSAYLSGKLGE